MSESIEVDYTLCNTPLLLAIESLDSFKKELGEQELAVTAAIQPELRYPTYIPESNLGIVDIVGGIVESSKYSTSHQGIREEVAQLIDMGAKTIVLDQASGGGVAHMTFESANYIRNLADENNVKLVSYVSNSSQSASYAYSAVAHEVIANPTAKVGSIGVLTRLVNTSPMMKEMGVEELYITSGEGKSPVDENGKFTQEFKDEVKAASEVMYQDFKNHVGVWRGIEPSTVQTLGAKTYSAKDALSNGLVDKIMTLEEFKNYLPTLISGSKPSMTNPIKSLFKTNPRKETAMSDTQVDVQAQLASLKEEMATQMAAFQAASEAKLAKEQAEKAELKAALDAIQKEKQEAKAAERLAELSALFGDTEAPALNASLASLDDVAFAAVVKTFEAKSEKKDAEMTAEIGEEGKVVVTSSAATVEELNAAQEARLKNKYSKKGAK